MYLPGIRSLHPVPASSFLSSHTYTLHCFLSKQVQVSALNSTTLAWSGAVMSIQLSAPLRAAKVQENQGLVTYSLILTPKTKTDGSHFIHWVMKNTRMPCGNYKIVGVYPRLGLVILILNSTMFHPSYSWTAKIYVYCKRVGSCA